jgi:hypothetical protein
MNPFPPPMETLLKVNLEAYAATNSRQYRTATGAHVGMTVRQLVKIYRHFGRPYIWDLPDPPGLFGNFGLPGAISQLIPPVDVDAWVCFNPLSRPAHKPGIHSLKFAVKKSHPDKHVGRYQKTEVERATRILNDPDAVVTLIYFDPRSDCHESLS